MKPPIPLLLACVLVVGSAAAWAENADRAKPMNVESDALRYDDQKRVNVFTGRVVLTKGSIVLRGALLEVRQDAQGYQFGVVTAEPGGLAFFRQKREGVDEYIEGEGQTIEYDGRADTVKFIKSAQLRRLRGATLADEVTGNVVLYNSSTDVFTVNGGAAATRAANGTVAPGGRVRAMLTPKSEPITTPGAAPSPAQAAAPGLRSSTALGEERK